MFAAAGLTVGVILEGPKLHSSISPNLLSAITFEQSAVVLVASVIVMFVVTLFRVPLSLSQAMIGAAIGAGVAARASLSLPYVLAVAASWVLTPALGFAIAYVAQIGLTRIFLRVRNVLTVNALYARLTFVISFYAAYTLGANTLGMVTGMIAGDSWNSAVNSFVLAGFAILGMWLFSHATAYTVAENLVGMSPSTALSAQLAGAVTMHVFTQFSIPISISQGVVGGVLGAAYTKRVMIRNRRVTREILFGWILAPVAGAILAFFMVYSRVLTF